MLLQRLKEYAVRVEKRMAEEGLVLIPSNYTEQPISKIINLDSNGKLIGFVSTSSGEAKKVRSKRFKVPYLRRSGQKIKPQLLADKAEFVFRIPVEDPKKDRSRCEARAQLRHHDFVTLVRACADWTKEDAIKAVVAFLEDFDRGEVRIPPDISSSETLTFRVGNVLPVEIPSVQKFWVKVAPYIGEKGVEKLTSNLFQKWLLPESPSKGSWQCVVCGDICSPARVHPIAIKLPRPVAEQQCSIVTANKGAFYSYGLEQSMIAPTHRDCAEHYAKAANALIETENTHITIGPVVYLFWTKEDVGFSPLTFFDRPEPDEVKALIKSAWKGREYTTVDETAFYATAFSASGGRVVVRDWLETTVGEVKKNLARWFVLQRIVESNGEERKPLRLHDLTNATVPLKKNKPDREKLSPEVPKVLLHTALKGGHLPKWLLSCAINRNRAEQKVTRPRAALIKMVLLSDKNLKEGGEEMERLDTENKSPGYLCGRLLAVLEKAQREAINPSATIVDRFFGTASSAPASVFSRLLRGSQAHLSKLRRDNPGKYNAIQQRIEEILSGLDGFPTVLALEEQGLFALGYYHQLAADRAAAIA